MKIINSTANIMIAKAKEPKWHQVSAHINRNNKRYSNKHINLEEDQENFHDEFENYDQVMTRKLTPFIRAHNAIVTKQGNKSRCYKSVKDYLRHNNYANQRNIIFYMGNENVRNTYYNYLEKHHHLKPNDIRYMEANALINVADYFRKHQRYIHISTYCFNGDESSPHLHTKAFAVPRGNQELNLGTKAHPCYINIRKPSLSFNKALCEDHPTAVNAKGEGQSNLALKQLRSKFDPMIIKSFNHTLRINGINDLRLHFVRTGKVNKFTMMEYQKHQDIKRAQKHLAHLRKECLSVKNTMNNLNRKNDNQHDRTSQSIQDTSRINSAVINAKRTIKSSKSQLKEPVQSIKPKLQQANQQAKANTSIPTTFHKAVKTTSKQARQTIQLLRQRIIELVDKTKKRRAQQRTVERKSHNYNVPKHCNYSGAGEVAKKVALKIGKRIIRKQEEQERN